VGDSSTKIIYKDEHGNINQMWAYEWHEVYWDKNPRKLKQIDAYNTEIRQHYNWARRNYPELF